MLSSSVDEADNLRVECEYTDIGSLATAAGTWRWAWANDYVIAKQREKSLRIRELAELTGMEVFGREVFEADEEMAWELAAVSVAQLNSLGCYRVPAMEEDLLIFLSIDSVLRLKR